MNCEEFQTNVQDMRKLAGLSLQERAMCFRHVFCCEDCQQWLATPVEIPDFEAAMRHTEAEEMAIKIAEADFQNPEFRKIAFGV